jgi:hypothetical protein
VVIVIPIMVVIPMIVVMIVVVIVIVIVIVVMVMVAAALHGRAIDRNMVLQETDLALRPLAGIARIDYRTDIAGSVQSESAGIVQSDFSGAGAGTGAADIHDAMVCE